MWIIHALNRLISIEVSFIKFTWSALFEISNTFDALLTFIHCIIYLILSCNKIKLNNIVSDINDFEMLLISVWKDDEKNFFCSIFIFSSNDSVIWLKSLLFNVFFYFFIKCIQSMTMTLSRCCVYAKLHVIWSKSLLYIFLLINHINSLHVQALSLKLSQSYFRFSLSLRTLHVLLFRF